MKRSRLAIIAVLAVAALGLGIFGFRAVSTGPSVATTKAIIDLNCQAQDLPCLTEQVLAARSANGNKAALDLVASYLDENPNNIDLCHTVVHSIGVAAWPEVKDITKIVTEGSSICSWAYLHGAMIAQFGGRTGDAVYTQAAVDCPQLKLIDNAAWGECSHGLGHAIYSALDRDFAATASICDRLTMDEGRIGCIQGAIMEHTNAFPTDPASALDAAKTLYRQCDALESTDMAENCVFSATDVSLRSDVDTKGAGAAWSRCEQLAGRHLESCAQGMGKAAVVQSHFIAADAGVMCASIPGPYGETCTRVAVDTFTTIFGDQVRAAEFCQKIDARLAVACRDELPNAARILAQRNG